MATLSTIVLCLFLGSGTLDVERVTASTAPKLEGTDVYLPLLLAGLDVDALPTPVFPLPTSSATPTATRTAVLTPTARHSTPTPGPPPATPTAQVGPQGAPDARYADCSETITRDVGRDGNADSIERLLYDGIGNKLLRELDNDADSVFEERTKYEYDAQGRWEAILTYRDADDTPDATVSFTYDSEGRLSEWLQDVDADGHADSLTSFEYNAEGRLGRRSSDSDADGLPDRIIEYTYNSDGDLARESNDTDGDGSPNIVGEYHWIDRLLDRLDTYINGERVRVERFWYDDMRRLVRHELDYDGDPDPETTWLYYYDDRGLTVKAERIRGTVDFRLTLAYDDLDRLVRMIEDDIFAGFIRESVHDIDCPIAAHSTASQGPARWQHPQVSAYHGFPQSILSIRLIESAVRQTQGPAVPLLFEGREPAVRTGSGAIPTWHLPFALGHLSTVSHNDHR